jgi:hypothetical protein
MEGCGLFYDSVSSYDITEMDLFRWGHLKFVAYDNRPRSIAAPGSISISAMRSPSEVATCAL